MQTKTKTQSDRKLIKDTFAFDPVDWARYPDGKLVFISPTGQKFGYSQEQLDNIIEAVRQERAGKKKLSSNRKSKSKEKNSSESTFLNPDGIPHDILEDITGGRGG